MKPGMFIVFEGIDGAGPTTQTKLLADWFAVKGSPAHLTWEPSQGRIGKMIREYLGGAGEPRLQEGGWVLADRYALSSLVYQSLHCDPAWVRSINAEAIRPHV